jgi:uncharacterized membrane protein YdjX (TVP38/TMEM64 family)
MTRSRLLLVALLVAVIAAWLALDAGQYLSIDGLRARYAGLSGVVQASPVLAGAVYFAVYIVVASLSIPGGALACTLAGGALFGLAWGCVLVSFASTCGATLACALSRFVLRDFVEQRFPAAAAKINAGIGADGAYYLFGMRLVTVFPFWIINLVMGLTRLPLRTFYWVSQVGMLPSTFLFVNAGTRLAQIHGARDILSPDVVVSLGLIGIFPLVARRLSDGLLAWHRKRT